MSFLHESYLTKVRNDRLKKVRSQIKKGSPVLIQYSTCTLYTLSSVFVSIRFCETLWTNLQILTIDLICCSNLGLAGFQSLTLAFQIWSYVELKLYM